MIAMKTKTKIKIAGAIFLTFIIAFVLGKGSLLKTSEHDRLEVSKEETAKKPAMWTCSMDPQIKLPNPGQCPICAMDLIPMEKSSDDEEGPRELSMSEAAVKLAEIQTAKVERKSVEKEVHMMGKVAFDETKLSFITAWVGGRIDRLYVDYTGIQISKGDHLVDLYSPELLAAQEELLQAKDTLAKIDQSEVTIVKSTTRALYKSARKKLRLWGLTQEQIQAIEDRGTIVEHMTIRSPVGGIVIHKNGTEGMYVKTGTKIYTIADLSKVWVKLDAYESDLQWIRYGQAITFTTKAYPGREFHGKIVFIDPVLNEKTRTVKVRVNVPNDDMSLKPGMFVSAIVRSKIAAQGKAIEAELAGKWICPMHPEIVKDALSACDICGMPLVKAEDLGYVVAKEEALPLVIPATAPLLTGKRAIVYVRLPGDKPIFEGRQVVLGPRAGDDYVVLSGLAKGEAVVVNGAFKIDSAMQLQAKPSMMSPEGGQTAPGHHHAGMSSKMPPMQKAQESVSNRHKKSNVSITKFLDIYTKLQAALADDDPTHLAHLAADLEKNLPNEEADADLQKYLNTLKEKARALAEVTTEDIEDYRRLFGPLSEAVIVLLETDAYEGRALYMMHCPMANHNAGARWLQKTPQLANPYFGASMLQCGSQVGVFSDQPEAPSQQDGE